MATSHTLNMANQPPPLEGYNLYEQDGALVEAGGRLDAQHLVPQVRAGFAAPRCAMRGASNPARWGTLHSVLPLHRAIAPHGLRTA